MSVPSRIEAAAILRGLRPNEKLLRHSTAVAEVAAFLAAAMAHRGVLVRSTLAETAALLHDLDKMLPTSDPLKELRHADAGAKWLEEHGYGELAPAVASHPVMQIGHAATYEEWATSAGLEGRIVTYADKRARQELLSLDERFAKWHVQYPDSPALDEAHERARRLEVEICELAGITPQHVQGEPWVDKALNAAA